MLIREFVIFIFIFIGTLDAVLYDVNTGHPVTRRQLSLFLNRNNTQYCLVNIDPCDPTEWKRVDGSCNNLNHPSYGASRTPTIRLLTPDFSIDYEPRLSQCGDPLPLPRFLRTQLLLEGKSQELKLTQLVSYYIVFTLSDVNTIHDVLNYIENTTNCCMPEGRVNYACTPNKIPVDDPIHRYSGVSCQNLTRPQTFQYFGCLEFGTTFSRTQYATPAFDLSNVYGVSSSTINEMRSFNNGLLKYDIPTFEQTGRVFPIGNHSEEYNRLHCKLNQYPRESLCYKYQPNTIMGSNLFLIMYYRQHNYIAKHLHELNPCWDDERLFYTARDINIAIYMQIFFYELLPILFGKTNMIENGLISYSKGFRDVYDEHVLPQTSDEYVYTKRWFHVIQESSAKFYDENGYFLKTYPMVNVSQRHGFMAQGNNMDNILRGSFRQPSGGFDHSINYDIAERILGGIHLISDVATNDLAKGRYFGFPSYIKYREFCTRRPCRTFDDLKDVISEERLYRLKLVYDNIEDIDLLSGLWSENHAPGTRVPYTVYCLMTEQLKRSLVSDRHWFERPNRPHAFTEEQLAAIRRVTVAGLICTNGGNIPEIQPKAFYSIDNQYNQLFDCNSPKIGRLDLSSWEDQRCYQYSY